MRRGALDASGRCWRNEVRRLRVGTNRLLPPAPARTGLWPQRLRKARLRPIAVGPNSNVLIQIRDRLAAHAEALASRTHWCVCASPHYSSCDRARRRTIAREPKPDLPRTSSTGQRVRPDLTFPFMLHLVGDRPATTGIASLAFGLLARPPVGQTLAGEKFKLAGSSGRSTVPRRRRSRWVASRPNG